nr:hypothetical protein [Candidatus Dactylopiibacterium carminicum]
MNRQITASFTATITLLSLADSRTPRDSTKVTASMIRAAGRLITVLTPGMEPGAALSATGSLMPKPASSD